MKPEEKEKKDVSRRKKKKQKQDKKNGVQVNESEKKENIVKEEEDKSRGIEKTEQQQMSSSKKRKRKEVFPFGNYRSYYGYRIGQGMDEDPRLKVLSKDWFEGKDCLDIGCNCGMITIQIAEKFHCRKILGIDIDSDRIADAYWHLRKFARAGGSGKNGFRASQMELTEYRNGSRKDEALSSVDEKENRRDCVHSKERDLFDIVSFRKENFVQGSSGPGEQYDTILCLSVTKWIHLNWGDDGLITLFSKIWRLLRPGGVLVLEPQPWRSYENNRRVSETVSLNYRTIMFRPESFGDILLDKIGFRRVEDLSSALSGSKSGFDRPIYAYHK